MDQNRLPYIDQDFALKNEKNNPERMMKVIGLIDGMSWESTAVYYRRINEQVRGRLGNLQSADILLRSVDFASIVALQLAGEWKQAAAVLCDIAKRHGSLREENRPRLKGHSRQAGFRAKSGSLP